MVGFLMARWVGCDGEGGVSREAASHTIKSTGFLKIPWCPASRPK